MKQTSRSSDRDTVVFLIWRDLPYTKRMAIGFSLIFLGFLLQWYSNSTFSGVIPLLAGNALLLVRGYDNRIEFKGFDPAEQWQKVEWERLIQLQELDKKMLRWDRSFMDITNTRGMLTFLTLALFLFMLYLGSYAPEGDPAQRILAVDIALLFLPHWFTGTRQIARKPGLLLKAKTLEQALNAARPEEQGHKVEVMMLRKGKEQKLPEDIKIRVMPQKAPEDFLGLYAQVVLNNVQGKSYPYFYVVLVARPSLSLQQLIKDLKPPRGVVVEYKPQKDADVLVIRQRTTKKSGYHTKPEKVATLLKLGMTQMQRLLREPLMES